MRFNYKEVFFLSYSGWMELIHWIIIFVVAWAVSTWLFRKHPSIKAYAKIFSIVRIDRLVEFIKKRKSLSKFTSKMADIGLILGFGVFASDYLYGKKQDSAAKRFAVAVISFVFLFGIFSLLFLSALIPNPVLGEFAFLLAFIFSVFGFAGFLVALLFITAFNILVRTLAGQPSCPQVAPIIPGVQIPQVPIFIPFYAWIGIFLAMIVHEASHGIQALGEKIKLKSAGVLLLGFFPIGAFVEPDEKELAKADERAKVRLYSAGPSSNLFLMLPLFAVLFLIGSFLVEPAAVAFDNAYEQGVDFVEVAGVSEELSFCGNPPAPAFGKLEEGMRFISVNGLAINTKRDVLAAIASNPFAESEFVVERNGAQETILITPHSETNSFGFLVEDKLIDGFEFPVQEYTDYYNVSLIWDIFRWALFISFLLGMFNFIPLVFLDGWHIAKVIYPPYLKPFIKKKADREHLVEKFFLLLILGLLVLNALPLFF